MFGPFDWLIFCLIFASSLIYYHILQWWSKEYPEHFDDNTWLTVVIGCSYVILWLATIIPFEYWFRIIVGFGVACLPIIYRSHKNNAQRRREMANFLENGKVDE